jgi:hypothetical protein
LSINKDTPLPSPHLFLQSTCQAPLCPEEHICKRNVSLILIMINDAKIYFIIDNQPALFETVGGQPVLKGERAKFYATPR